MTADASLPKNKGGRPKGSKDKKPRTVTPGSRPRIPIDYKLIAALAQAQCTHQEMAAGLGMSSPRFSEIYNEDEFLRETIENNYGSGKISLRRAQMRKAMDRYLTVCDDCHKIHQGEFLKSCPYCDELDEPDMKGKHTKVRHRYIQGDTTMMIWLGKQVLHQSDHVTMAGDKDRPLLFNTLAEFVRSRALRAREQKKAKQ